MTLKNTSFSGKQSIVQQQFDKLKKRLAKNMGNGSIFKYSRRKRQQLIQRYNRYARQLKRVGMSTGLIALLMAASPENSQAQTYAACDPNPFNGLSIGYNSTPTFGDVDGDGDLDIVSGDIFGTFFYYENTASGYTQQTGAANPFAALITGSSSSPTLVDVDSDGDLDLVAGTSNGIFYYYENTGSGYTEQTGASNPFDGLDAGDDSSPTFVDVDGDGDLDLVAGEYNGTFKYYENTGSGYTEQTGAANPFDGLDVGSYSNPTFLDVDGDGDLDLVSGEYYGIFVPYCRVNPPACNADNGTWSID